MKNANRTSAGLLGGGIAAAMLLLASTAEASESASSVYLLGSGGPGAAIVPPIEGVFLVDTQYHYSGEAGVDREFVIGGNVVAGLDARVDANFATAHVSVSLHGEGQ